MPSVNSSVTTTDLCDEGVFVLGRGGSVRAVMTRSLCAISIHHTCPSQTVNLVVGSVYATWTGTRRTRVHGERHVYQGPASLTRQSWQCIDCTHVTTMLAHNGISRASPSIGSRLTAFWTHFRSRRHRAVGASTRAADGHFLIMLMTLMHDVERWSTGDSRVKLVSRVHRASECLPATNHRPARGADIWIRLCRRETNL